LAGASGLENQRSGFRLPIEEVLLDTRRREQIQRSLRSLADCYAATLETMEQNLTLLGDELTLDPLTYFRTRVRAQGPSPGPQPLRIDPNRRTVYFRGRTRFLGGRLPFRLLGRLARRPNTFVSHEDLLEDVWDGAVRSDDAVRSAVKALRQRLRPAGLGDLADAIDGTVPGHYALRLDR
jgi:DNA-binding response OmpR family regulator